MARFTLRIPARLKDGLEKQSTVTGLSLNALILKILWDWAERRRGE